VKAIQREREAIYRQAMEIIDAEWRAAGLSQEELDLETRLADALARRLAAGEEVGELLARWQTLTPQEILEEAEEPAPTMPAGCNSRGQHDARCPDGREAERLRQINQALAGVPWEKFDRLLAKRRAETLTPDEQAELVALTDEVEELNARRMECLAELARLKGMALPALMDELGIEAAPCL
jgi:hypothetical protein